ncbi:hypothetical protein M404DRAFT_150512 [Pisolithus tinctorius Marx 270]|uniref:DUF4939 domain-containing protein n=1 Tax=Pisolithus tinctorius Marx 270 TaxID=870435 RepID=A0A0C3JUX8_PISTI|nr:hypothetical protein M404DRAFT_150512 [Pisolithus tinctorius Marx 270]
MRTQAQSHREVTENLNAALANPHCLPSVIKQFQPFSTQHHSCTEGESASQAGHSDLHPTTFHTLSPHNQDDGPNPDPDNPDGDPNGRGSGDGDIPKDLAEPPEDPLVALARAIHVLVQSSLHTGDSAPKTKVHKPNTFDGSDPKKLCEFLIQCELNFQDCPCAFRSNRAKVTFTQSYLKGMALAWFKPDLLNPKGYECLFWMDNYHEFLHELTTNFGPHDTIADAIQQLKNLTMKDNCIKDEITHIRKPSTLAQLCKLTQTINAHYCECKAEISHITKSATNKLKSSNSNNKSKSLSSTSTPKSNAKGKGKQKDLPKSNIAHLLGKDGKLTSASSVVRLATLLRTALNQPLVQPKPMQL